MRARVTLELRRAPKGEWTETRTMAWLSRIVALIFVCGVLVECRSKHRKVDLSSPGTETSKHRAGDLIGWRGESHKVETGMPEPGQPFVLSTFWDQGTNQPLGVDQWVAWYHGFMGDNMEESHKYELLQRRLVHQSQQLTQPCMTLKKFVEAGKASKAFDEMEEADPKAVESIRIFPAQGVEDRSGLPLYAHMATLATCQLPGNGSLVLAFQASPSIEGGDGQRIWIAFSKDRNGMEWWPPIPVPIDQGGSEFRSPEGKFVTAAQWGPVLHSDTNKIMLFFSESGGDCHEPANPEEGHGGRWVVGGDIKVTALLDQHGRWEESRSIHKQSEGKIPKITANGAITLSSHTVILPFWRQKPRHIFIHNLETDQVTRRCSGPSKGKRRTSASVLVSHDKGKTWKAHGKLEQKVAGWLIENTLVERSDKSLWMLFRTKAGRQPWDLMFFLSFFLLSY